jgi:serine/threonine protein kinase
MDSKGHHLIGKQLGSCVLEQLVGSGGMGMVFLARQEPLARDVAVKVLRSGADMQSPQNEEFLIRFRREANVIAHLDHINILPLYEYDEQDGLAYLVMPYLAGGSLRDLLAKREGPLSPHQALTYIEQAAAALQYAHDHKIVHRDIKPGNMLLHSDGRLVIVDFGIAHIMQESVETAEASLTGAGHFLGSVDYMAPEMAQGRRVDNRTDIYELGIVLFQMLAGRVPFQGMTPFFIAAQHIQEPAPHVYDFQPNVPYELDAVVQKAIAKDPDARYQTIQGFASALREAVTHAYAMPEMAEMLSMADLDRYPERHSAPAALEYSTRKIATTEVPTPSTPRPTPSSSKPRREPSTMADYPTRRQMWDKETRTPPIQESEHAQIEQQSTSLTQQQTPPPANPRQRRSRSGLLLVLLLVIVAVLVSVLVIGHSELTALLSPQPTPTATSAPPQPTAMPTTLASPTPTLTADQQAQALVQKLYDDVNKGDFRDAYNLWGNDYHQGNTYQKFVNGYNDTMSDDVVPGKTQDNPDGTFTVNVTLYATNNDSNVTVFTGPYFIGMENGSLKILNANLKPAQNQASTPTNNPQDAMQANNLVQQYYAAINNHDYRSAYSLWDANHQKSYPYANFEKGYATTQHDDVTITGTQPLTNNTYRVMVVVKSQDQAPTNATATPTGTPDPTSTPTSQVANFTGAFIVGQENGVWKLQNADLQPDKGVK